MIKVIDDFANIQEQLELINLIERECSGYTFYTTSSFIFGENNIYKPFLFPYVYSLLHMNKLSNKFINRIKINTTFPFPKNNKDMYGPIHIDTTIKKSISIIYYVNNSDGDTLFFNEELNIIKRVSPRQGRAIVFDSNTKHTACCPINSKYRQVINFVLY
jgi:hypothetical protein